VNFSGIALYEPWIYQLYNTAYTALPIFIYAIVDKEFGWRELIE
jgi:phospholipid-transporting ATPase